MGSPMSVTVFMDVEDLVALESDDVARDCAEILSQEGVPATFCVVGEKARLLLQRGRDDVISAMARHDIGLHTDFHSVHPTIAEAMADRDWDEGVAEAERMERPGAEAIERVFGRPPSCWGGPGNTWGPQVCEALTRIGIPAFVYAHTEIPEGGVHRFAGCIAYPNGPSLNDGDYHDDAKAELQSERLALRVNAETAAGARWQQVFLGHPTRLLHEEFWDAGNFAQGANPCRDKWKPARQKSPEDLRRALANFRRAARMLGSLPGIEIRTLSEMNVEFQSAATSSISPLEREAVWPRIERNLQGMKGWPIFPPDFSADNIAALTYTRLNTLRRFVEVP